MVYTEISYQIANHYAACEGREVCMTKITPQMWLDWQRSPATAAIIEHLETRKNDLVGQLLNLDIQSHTVESYGIAAIAIRYHLEGMGEFLDLDTLEATLVQPKEGDA